MKMKNLVLGIVVGVGAAACKGQDAPSAPVLPQIVLPGMPAPAARPTAPDDGDGPRDATPLSTSISLEFVDRQFFHAASRNRVMLDPRDTTKTRRLTGANFGVGLTIAARNDSPHLLDNPRVLSDVVVEGANGRARCRTETNRYGYPVVGVVSPDVNPRTAWGDESRSFLESPWRPGETIRIVVNLDCGPIHIQDLGVTRSTGAVRIAARALFNPSDERCILPNRYVCADDVLGTTAALELPGRAIVLQQASLPSGDTGYSAGDLFIHLRDGRPVFESLGTLGTSAFAVTGTDLPAAAQPARETLGEWGMAVTGVTMRSWHEVPGTQKGQRIVTVSADVSIDAGALTQRVSAGLAPEDDVAAAVEDERGRLAGLLACDGVQLVTQTRLLRATNGRDAKAACTTLASGDRAQVSWTFTLDRYELPLGITYAVDRAPRTTFFANLALSTFDPR